MSQINSNIQWADSGPNAVVNAEKISDHVNQATLLNGAVLDQPVNNSPQPVDCVLLGVAANADTVPPNKVALQNLLPDAIRWGQGCYAAATGGPAAYVITLTPTPLAYTAGMQISFLAPNANTGAATLQIQGLGTAPTIKTPALADLSAGNISAQQIVDVVFDGTYWQMTNVTAAGSLSAAQISEPARMSENQFIMDTGAAAGQFAAVLVPAVTNISGPAAGMVVRFKAIHASVSGSNTLSVNGLTAKTILKNGTQNLTATDIVVGQLVEVAFDGTNFQMTSPVNTPNTINNYFRAGTATLTAATALTISFSSAVPDANYVVVTTCETVAGGPINISNKTSSSFQAAISGAAGSHVIDWVIFPMA